MSREIMLLHVPGYWRKGQATVEAALVLPILLGLILLLLQPGIVLYDRTVMQSAAAEACRTLCTVSDGGQEVARSLALRRLGSVPQQDLFHVHEGSCTWDVRASGGESSDVISVTIENELKPLPLISFCSTALGLTNENGNFRLSVTTEMQTQPDWVASSSAGSSAADWVGAWLE